MQGYLVLKKPWLAAHGGGVQGAEAERVVSRHYIGLRAIIDRNHVVSSKLLLSGRKMVMTNASSLVAHGGGVQGAEAQRSTAPTRIVAPLLVDP